MYATHKRIGLAGAGIAGMLVFVVASMWSAATPKVPEADKAVKAWLDDLCKGGNGRQFWKSDTLWPSPQFFAVQSYTVLNIPFPGRHIVRIHSSKQDGSPVVRVYEVLSDGNRVYRVTAQGDDPDEDVKRLWNGPTGFSGR